MHNTTICLRFFRDIYRDVCVLKHNQMCIYEYMFSKKNILLRVLLKDVTGTSEYNYERKKINFYWTKWQVY